MHRRSVYHHSFLSSIGALRWSTFYVMSTALGSLALRNTAHLDLGCITLDLPLTPNPYHSQFFSQSPNLTRDHMHDIYTSPDTSLMVSALISICAPSSFFSLYRVHYLLLWNLNLVEHQRNSCSPVGIPPFYNLSSYSNTKDGRSAIWKTTFACWRQTLWHGGLDSQLHSKIGYDSLRLLCHF